MVALRHVNTLVILSNAGKISYSYEFREKTGAQNFSEE